MQIGLLASASCEFDEKHRQPLGNYACIPAVNSAVAPLTLFFGFALPPPQQSDKLQASAASFV